ncbi:MAG: hypothetical protein KF862_18605 [Chitinophagaceae bacterium]|nr:hypothetical protein [Chitinophagaceae bacterium]
MRKKALAILFFIFIAFVGQTQTKDTILPSQTIASYNKDFSLLTGYSQGRYAFADIGLAINYYGTNRHPFSIGYFVSNEIKLNKDLIIGPKIGVWIAGGIAMGLNLIYYTDFDKSSLVLRPEIGIGILKTKLVYGYNWRWTNSLTNINQHQVDLTYCFRLKRFKSR